MPSRFKTDQKPRRASTAIRSNRFGWNAYRGSSNRRPRDAPGVGPGNLDPFSISALGTRRIQPDTTAVRPGRPFDHDNGLNPNPRHIRYLWTIEETSTLATVDERNGRTSH